jgi:hypothetical protein
VRRSVILYPCPESVEKRRHVDKNRRIGHSSWVELNVYLALRPFIDNDRADVAAQNALG